MERKSEIAVEAGQQQQLKNGEAKVMPTRVAEILRCCRCLGPLEPRPGSLQCKLTECRAIYPVVNGVPVIIDEQRSIFTHRDFTERRDTFFPTRSRLKKFLTGLVPRITRNVKAKKNYSRFAELLTGNGARQARVLVIGGSILGEGMEEFATNQRIELIETDVSFGPRCSIICDGHDLPFEEGSFDGVVAQAVLEHVLDPFRCVQEIHRVLKPNGYIYAETPFMQQVHSRAYDFTRFTLLGHRRLFRAFTEIESGASCGPGAALAWSYEYFLLSFAKGATLRRVITMAARITAFPLTYCDYFLANTPGGLDAASAYYFMGQKSSRPLTDRELVSQYRGAQ